MRLVVLYLGTPIGSVTLDQEEPAAGWLVSLPAYREIQPILRRAGDLLVLSKYREVAGTLEIRLRAREIVANLSLATEAGTAVQVASIDLWDDSMHKQPPFVLVYARAQPSGVVAGVSRNPGRGGAAC